MKRLIIGLVVALVLVGGGYVAYLQTQPTADTTTTTTTTTDVNTLTVDTGTEEVSAEGRIVPLETADLPFLLGGPVAEILVTEGQTVAAGEALIQLVNNDQQLALTQAQAALTQAQANVQTAQAGVTAAEAGVTAAEVGVQSAQAQLDLLQAGPTTEQIALSEQGVEVAEAGVAQAAGSRDAALEATSTAEIQAAEAQLAAAQAQVVSLQISYDQVKNSGAGQAQIDQAWLQLVAGQAQVTAAQAKIDELRAGATLAEQQSANGGVGAAQNQFLAAQAQLNLLLVGTRPEQIAIAEANLAQAEQAVVEAELRVQQAQSALTQAESGVALAETAVTAAQALLDKMVLKAPFAGVVANVNAKVGEVVVPGVPVVTLADFSGWQVETTDLTELNVVAVAVGFPAEITIDAFPGETLTGTITDISSVSNLVLGDVTYVVTVALDDPGDLPLRWGMTTFVTIDVTQ